MSFSGRGDSSVAAGRRLRLSGGCARAYSLPVERRRHLKLQEAPSEREEAPPDERAEAREALLTTGITVVAELGPEGLKVPYVASRAGIDRGLAYEHFPTRDDLIAAVNVRVSEELTSMLSMDVDPSSFLDYVIDYAVQHPEIARLWMYQLVSGNHLSARDSQQAYQGFMEQRLLGDSTRDGIDAEVLAQFLLGAVLAGSLYAQSEMSEERPLAEYAARFSAELKRLLLYGVMKPERWPGLVSAVKDARKERDDEASG